MILKAFEEVMSIEHITVEDSSCVLQALKWYSYDIDFADALHLSSCQKIKNFATLDKNFIKKARKFNINFLTLQT